MEHEELKFPVPLESVGTIARYLELEAPLCGPADGVTAGFSIAVLIMTYDKKIYEQNRMVLKTIPVKL